MVWSIFNYLYLIYYIIIFIYYMVWTIFNYLYYIIIFIYIYLLYSVDYIFLGVCFPGGMGVHGSLVVSVLALGFKSRPGQKFGLRFMFHLHPCANSAVMNTLTAHCQWYGEMVRERIDHPPSCAESKKMKSLTLHTHGCPRVS